jgi:hypothetical protein
LLFQANFLTISLSLTFFSQKNCFVDTFEQQQRVSVETHALKMAAEFQEKILNSIKSAPISPSLSSKSSQFSKSMKKR